MKTFFLNTCTPLVRLAIFHEDKLMGETHWESHKNEAEKIQGETKKLLKQKKLTPESIDRIAVCVGPGGFTTTRIGVSIANAWAFAKDLPLATFTLFDLFPKDVSVVIPCNASEAWIRQPNKEPEFVTGKFTATVNQETFPLPSTLQFGRKQAEPWYYKDAKITWSKRIHHHE